jgi:hypothetical protein
MCLLVEYNHFNGRSQNNAFCFDEELLNTSINPTNIPDIKKGQIALSLPLNQLINQIQIYEKIYIANIRQNTLKKT